MPDILTILSIFAGFAFIIVVGAKLGAGGTDSVLGLFRFEDLPRSTAWRPGDRPSPVRLPRHDAPRVRRRLTPSAPATGQSQENRGMADGPTFISAIAGFGIVIVAGSMLGGGSHSPDRPVRRRRATRDWPTGVQEADAPHFVFAHERSRARPARSDRGDDFSRAVVGSRSRTFTRGRSASRCQPRPSRTIGHSMSGADATPSPCGRPRPTPPRAPLRRRLACPGEPRHGQRRLHRPGRRRVNAPSRLASSAGGGSAPKIVWSRPHRRAARRPSGVGQNGRGRAAGHEPGLGGRR